MSFAVACIFIYMSGRVSEREETKQSTTPIPTFHYHYMEPVHEPLFNYNSSHIFYSWAKQTF